MDSVGIEIKKNIWSVVCLRKTPFGLKIHCCREIAGVSDEDKFKALSDLIQQEGLISPGIAIGLPKNCIISRVLSLPALNTEAIENILKYELEKHIPFQLTDVYYDFQILEKRDGLFSVLITVVAKSKLSEAIEVFQKNNIAPLSVDSSQRSIFNALCYWKVVEKDDNFVLISIDKGCVAMDVYAGSAPVYSELIDIDGKNSDEWIEDIKNGLRHLMQTAKASTWSSSLKSILVVGEEPPEPGFLSQLENITGLPVVVPDLSEAGLSSMALSSAGLALSVLGKVRLTSSLFQSSTQPKREAFVLNKKIMAVIVVFLWCSLGASYLMKDIFAINRFEAAISELENERVALRELSVRLEDVDKSLSILGGSDDNISLNSLDVLREITRLLPDGTWLTGFEFKNGVVYLNGFSGEASSLLVLLERSEFVEDVEFVGQVTKDKGRQGKERFRIKTHMRNIINKT